VDNIKIEEFLILININNKNATDKTADFGVGVRHEVAVLAVWHSL
jgi:hypothetical protein